MTSVGQKDKNEQRVSMAPTSLYLYGSLFKCFYGAEVKCFLSLYLYDAKLAYYDDFRPKIMTQIGTVLQSRFYWWRDGCDVTSRLSSLVSSRVPSRLVWRGFLRVARLSAARVPSRLVSWSRPSRLDSRLASLGSRSSLVRQSLWWVNYDELTLTS